MSSNSNNSSKSSSSSSSSTSDLWIHLFIDSDNNNGKFGGPNRDNHETSIKNAPGEIGKVIPLNHGDADNDNVIDCWDGYVVGSHDHKGNNRSDSFVPIVVEIPGWLNLNDITISFNYRGYVTPPPANKTLPPQDANEGTIRIWRKNGKIGRNGWDVDVSQAGEPGDHYAASRPFSGTRYGFSKNSNQNWEVTLYVEGLTQSQQLGRTIKATLAYTPQGGTQQAASDQVRYSVGDFIVHGRITYDQNYPVRHAMITIDDTGWYTSEIARFYTDKDGYYTFGLPLNQKDKIDYMTVHTYSNTLTGGRTVSVATNFAPVNPSSWLTDAYSARFFDAYHDPSDTSLRDNSGVRMKVDILIDDLANVNTHSSKKIDETKKKAFYIYDPMVTSAQVHGTLPGVVPKFTPAIFPWYGVFTSMTFLGATHIIDENYEDWDLICHEYGHIVAQEAGFFNFDLFPNPPYIHHDHSSKCNNRHYYNHECKHCTHLAFGEGWANFYSMFAQKVGYTIPKSGVNDDHLWGYSVENANDTLSGARAYLGEDQEIAIMRLFWDLYDDYSASEPFDTLHYGMPGVYNILRGASGGGVKWNANDLWHFLTDSIPQNSHYLDEMMKFSKVFTKLGMGVTGFGYSGGPMTPPTFNWSIPHTMSQNPNTNVTKSIRLFDTFQIVFFDANGTIIAQSPNNLLGPDWTPSDIFWSSIVRNIIIPSGGGEVFAVVTCKKSFNTTSSTSPLPLTTGPYWSDCYLRIAF